jgi:hypothetical protein
MTQRNEPEVATPVITDDEVDALLHEAQGDPREAIRMLLHDLAVMASDANRLVSHGFVRGLQPWKRTR